MNFAKLHKDFLHQAKAMGAHLVIIYEEQYVQGSKNPFIKLETKSTKKLSLNKLFASKPELCNKDFTFLMIKELKKLGAIMICNDGTVEISADYKTQVIYLGFDGTLQHFDFDKKLDFDKPDKFNKLKHQMEKVSQASDMEFLDSVFDSLFPNAIIHRLDLEYFTQHSVKERKFCNADSFFQGSCSLVDNHLFELPDIYLNHKTNSLVIVRPIARAGFNLESSFLRDMVTMKELGIIPLDTTPYNRPKDEQ